MQIRLTITFLALLFTNILSAQTPLPSGSEKKENKVYKLHKVQKPPSFPGEEIALNKFIADSLRYLVALKNAKLQGTLTLSLIVEKDGSLSALEVLKDIGGGSRQEAIRLFKSMPKWIPGEARGSIVRTRVTIPVQFKLD